MLASRKWPRLIQHKRFARNSFIPEAPFARRLVTGQNHVMAFRRKTFLTANTTPPAAGVASADLYRVYCHTGHGATHMRVKVGMMMDTTSTGVDPFVRVAVTEVGVGTTNLDIHGGAYTGTPSDGPGDILWRSELVPVTANAAHSIVVSISDYARLQSILIYEVASDVVDSAVNYYAEVTPSTEHPIYDSVRQTHAVGLSQIWRHNAGHLMNWPGNGTSAASPTNATTTWTNVIDAATSVTASTAGFWLGDTGSFVMSQMARQYTADTLDVVFAAHLSCTGSATAEVRLEDSGGTIISMTGKGTASAWYTVTGSLANLGDIAKCDLQFRTSNAANTVTLNAVCMYAYLA